MLNIPDVIAYLQEMGATVGKHIEQLTAKQSKTGKKLTKPFEDISNKIQILIKITPQICETPFKTKVTSKLGEIQKQVLKTIYRDLLFVSIMSTIEYYFPRILLQYSQYQASGIDKKTMRDLINWASKENILVDDYLWKFANYARNDIVHRNAFAKSTMKSPIHDFPINMVKDRQLSGKLRSLLSLTGAIEESFYEMVLRL